LHVFWAGVILADGLIIPRAKCDKNGKNKFLGRKSVFFLAVTANISREKFQFCQSGSVSKCNCQKIWVKIFILSD
jgi:hypothetical protein